MSTNISSRTPEGTPNRCPVCEDLICIEPSQPALDAPCPRCGTLLWFIQTSSGVSVYEAATVSPWVERILRVMEDLGVNRGSSPFWEESRDSLAVVELVMELEEAFDLTIPDDAAEKMRTVGDALDWLVRQRLE